jgi:Helix-turn-helix of DDE superfamily endonuclease
MRYQDEKTKAYRILDLTSLTVEEFEQLLEPFEAAFVRHMRDWTMEGKPRTGRRYSQYTNCPLPTPEDRLLFILSYLKVAALQVAQGALFGMTQSNANKWIHVLLLVLHQTLVDLHDVPARHLRALEDRLAELKATEQVTSATDSTPARSPFFMMAPNARSRAPKLPMNKVQLIAARKSGIR